jgi:hypothetical protein
LTAPDHEPDIEQQNSGAYGKCNCHFILPIFLTTYMASSGLQSQQISVYAPLTRKR